MGNAMDFLNDKDNRDKRRKGSHHKKCKDKIDKYLEENETTKCEDYNLIQRGSHRSGHTVNDRQVFEGSISGINARLFEKRKPVTCKACSTEFIPRKAKKQLSRHERKLGKGAFDIWCPQCTVKGTKYRNLLVKLGGYENYMDLKVKLVSPCTLTGSETLYTLFEQRDLRVKLYLSVLRIDNLIEMVVDKAYKENEERLQHYEFDF